MFDSRRAVVVLLGLMLLIAGGLYAPGFAGYWLGDDFSNLHRAYVWSINGEVGAQLWRQLSSSTSEGAAFFRPLIIVSLTFDFLRSGTDYASWYAYNYFVHLSNMLLVALLVRRMAAWAGADAGMAAPLAAGLFGLTPLLAEGVFWLSARSDASVTLFGLFGLLAWVGRREQARPPVFWLPICLLPALLFKESAALLPLQAGLVWLATPALRERRRLFALIAAAALVAVFLAWRSVLFGSAWQVYGGAATPLTDAIHRLPVAVASVLPWLHGLVDAQWSLLLVYGALLVVVVATVSIASRTRQRGLALVAAGAGALLATLLNLGALAGSGEGGRLLYSPLAWLALALGVACARPIGATSIPQQRLRQLSNALLAMAVLVGVGVLHPLLDKVWSVQSALKNTAAVLPQAALHNPDGMLLLLPDAVGPVVAVRNGQAAFVLRPLQPQGLIDRLMPTLPAEVHSRHGQYADGLLDQLQAANLQHFDVNAPSAKPLQTRARWPARIACWSSQRRRLIEFPAPAADDAKDWTDQILADAGKHGCWTR
ncbi:MAG: hypothetical protein ACT4NL_06400 [Pseudomarimonas sp.]